MTIKNFAFTSILFFLVLTANAQQKLSDGTGDNSLTVNQNAILELASKNKGLLHTRVALEATGKPTPMNTHVAGIMVYNTETRNDVVPGIYYNDGKRWILASGGKATSISYNPTTYEISFIDETGAPVTIDFKAVVKKNETVTTLVAVGKGVYEYTSENGTKTIINVPADVINNFETIVKEENVKNEIVNLIKNIGGNVYYDGNKFTYVTTTGEVKEITIKEIVAANETLTVLSYNQVTNALTYKDEKGKEEIINLNIGTIVYDSGTNTITYVDGNGRSTPLVLNETSLVYDDVTKVLTYKDSRGKTNTIDLAALVVGHETETTLVKGMDGTYTYTNERSKTTIVDIPAEVINNFQKIVKEEVTVDGRKFNTVEEYITYLTESKGGFTKIVYDQTTGDVIFQEWDATTSKWVNVDNSKFETIVRANETVTNLGYDPATGIATYTNEEGTPQTLDLKGIVKNFETLTTVSVDNTAGTLTYVDEKGEKTVLKLGDFVKSNETVTNLGYDPATGIATYTNEEGTPQTLDLKGIVKNFETLTTVSVDNTAGTLTYVDEKGEKTVLKLGDFVKSNETVTNLGYDPATGIATYTNEEGTPQTLDLKGIVKNFETLTTVSVDNTAGTLTYVDEKGAETVLKLGDFVKAQETLTVLGYDKATNTLSYKDEKGVLNTIELGTGVISYDEKTNTITYTDAKGVSTPLVLNETSLVYNDKTNVLTYTNSKGTPQTVDLGALVSTNTTNELKLQGSSLTSTVNGKSSTVTLTEESLTSTKGVTSTSIAVGNGGGSTLKDVTLEIKPGENGQVMVTKGDKSTWVNQSEIVPTTTHTLVKKANTNGNTVISKVNDVSAEIDLVDNVANSLTADNKLITTVNGKSGGGIDLTPAIQSGQKTVTLTNGVNTAVTQNVVANNTEYKVNVSDDAIQAAQKTAVVAAGSGVTVDKVSDGNVTTYTVNANPASIALGGDVTGNADNTTISKIQGKVVEATNPVAGNVLVFENGKWVTKTPTVDVTNVTSGKALSSTDLDLSGESNTALLKAVTANIKTGAVTSDKILDGTIKPIDIADAGANQVLVTGANSKPTWIDQSALGNTVTADNGLTKTTNNIQLGGKLLKETTITQEGKKLEIATAASQFVISGLDKKKVQATDKNAGITDRLLAVGNDNVVKALKAAMPKFFYMPSIIIPTSLEQLNAPGAGKVTGDAFNNGTGTLNLYGRYVAQFGTTGTVLQPSSPGAPVLPVLPAGELHYYVTWFDQTVFETVAIDANGVMTYKVKSGADITVGSFMNIIFAVKEDPAN
ncbi:hypothetical protein [Sphingobacterium tabacisoli]|nr:hypothetical protein [Sphingobacterium tabacisoli]